MICPLARSPVLLSFPPFYFFNTKFLIVLQIHKEKTRLFYSFRLLHAFRFWHNWALCCCSTEVPTFSLAVSRCCSYLLQAVLRSWPCGPLKKLQFSPSKPADKSHSFVLWQSYMVWPNPGSDSAISITHTQGIRIIQNIGVHQESWGPS